MKWNQIFTLKDSPLANKRRVVKKFLLFPTSISGQTRWLETVYIRQVHGYYIGWQDEEWATKMQYESYFCNPSGWISQEEKTNLAFIEKRARLLHDSN